MLLDAAAAASPPPCVCVRLGLGLAAATKISSSPPPPPRTSPGPRSTRGAPGTAGPTASAGSIARPRFSRQRRPGRARGRLVGVCPRCPAAAEGPPHQCALGPPRSPAASTPRSGTAASGSCARLSARGWGFEGHPGEPPPQNVPAALRAVPGAQHPAWAPKGTQTHCLLKPKVLERAWWAPPEVHLEGRPSSSSGRTTPALWLPTAAAEPTSEPTSSMGKEMLTREGNSKRHPWSSGITARWANIIKKRFKVHQVHHLPVTWECVCLQVVARAPVTEAKLFPLTSPGRSTAPSSPEGCWAMFHSSQ